MRATVDREITSHGRANKVLELCNDREWRLDGAKHGTVIQGHFLDECGVVDGSSLFT